LKRNAVHRLWEDPKAIGSHRTGVSLHGHTLHSREQLSFLGAFRQQFPIIPAVLAVAARHHRRATGQALDWNRAGWRPPLTPSAAYRLEKKQIGDLGLAPLVSLSDHDDVEAGLTLRRAGREAPVSVEWTIPCGPTFFHLGVHNIPLFEVEELWDVLSSYARMPSAERLAGALELLHESPDVLVVFNHALWDEGGIGETAHRAAVEWLLGHYGDWIHAFELNGLRTRAENAAVVALAEAWRKPVISGGDRHGAEPNANINLTNARTFAEFVSEVRRDGQSTVLFLPQYREPLRLRWLQTVWDIVRPYPEAHECWRYWSDRFFYICEDGVQRSVARVWKTARPPLLDQMLGAVGLAQYSGFQYALKLVLADQQE
jgi:hypothetical protein